MAHHCAHVAAYYYHVYDRSVAIADYTGGFTNDRALMHAQNLDDLSDPEFAHFDDHDFWSL